jgi:hypothetical protein
MSGLVTLAGHYSYAQSSILLGTPIRKCAEMSRDSTDTRRLHSSKNGFALRVLVLLRTRLSPWFAILVSMSRNLLVQSGRAISYETHRTAGVHTTFEIRCSQLLKMTTALPPSLPGCWSKKKNWTLFLPSAVLPDVRLGCATLTGSWRPETVSGEWRWA